MSATFQARGQREPTITRRDREAARAGCLIYRASDGLEVAVPESVVERGVAHCRRVRPLEWYGALVGTRHEDEHGRHILVRGLVLDPDAKATSSRVESTIASEAALRRVAALYYPDAHVIGWCHGHPPGIGAFYSSTDRENQASWGEPDAIGIVFEAEDPKRLAVFRGPRSEGLVLVRDGQMAHSTASSRRAARPSGTNSHAIVRPAACACQSAAVDLARRALRVALVASMLAGLSPIATVIALRVTDEAGGHGSVGATPVTPPGRASTDGGPHDAAPSDGALDAMDAGAPTVPPASADPLDGGAPPIPIAADAAVEVPDAALDAPCRDPRSRTPRRRSAPTRRLADEP